VAALSLLIAASSVELASVAKEKIDVKHQPFKVPIPECEIKNCKPWLGELCYRGQHLTGHSCTTVGFFIGNNDFIRCADDGGAHPVCKEEKGMSIDIATLRKSPEQLNQEFCDKQVTKETFLELCNKGAVVAKPAPAADEPTQKPEPKAKSMKLEKCAVKLPYMGEYTGQKLVKDNEAKKSDCQQNSYWSSKSTGMLLCCWDGHVHQSCPLADLKPELQLIPPNADGVHMTYISDIEDCQGKLGEVVVDMSNDPGKAVQKTKVETIAEKKTVGTATDSERHLAETNAKQRAAETLLAKKSETKVLTVAKKPKQEGLTGFDVNGK